MAARDSNVTVEQFNQFAKSLVDTLNKTHEHIYRRFDNIEARLSNLDTKVDELNKAVSIVQTNVTSVKRDTKLLPPIFELLEQDGEDIALRAKIKEMEN